MPHHVGSRVRGSMIINTIIVDSNKRRVFFTPLINALPVRQTSFIPIADKFLGV